MTHLAAINRTINRLKKAIKIPMHEEGKRHINVALLYLKDIKRNFIAITIYQGDITMPRLIQYKDFANCNDSGYCNGFHHCKDRKFNQNQNDCKECETDLDQALHKLERPEEV